MTRSGPTALFVTDNAGCANSTDTAATHGVADRGSMTRSRIERLMVVDPDECTNPNQRAAAHRAALRAIASPCGKTVIPLLLYKAVRPAQAQSSSSG
jgi:hypothetical protein